ncbi:MAG: nucleotidyltransferase [Candidatus Electrothrix sp. GM3_4]|nr:nucleotidyltransferase [Candidatus Electrothrix sp. GM3_4]
MPARSINEGFRTFHSNITSSNYESGKAASHKVSITRRLEEYYDLNQLFYSGSANNGTSISCHSDVDFFASIPSSKLKNNSATSLREIKQCLQKRFPNTKIHVDSPAVVLNFGSAEWDTAEVIPADYVEQKTGNRVYDIPDGAQGWMRSSPSIHNAYVRAENNRLNKKLKPLIRFLKAWKYYCNVPISSFYLELRATKWMEAEETIIYDMDLCTLFKKLDSCALADMQDPKGISGYIPACATEAKKTDALSKLATAKTRAEKAREEEKEERTKNAFDWWDKLFAGNFPGYYK